MSRINRLLRLLSSRTDLRTGRRVSASGTLPLTVTGTFGGFPLRGYAVLGASEAANDTSPTDPKPPKFVGDAVFPGDVRGLSLVFTTEGTEGGGGSVTVTLPGVDPLRAVGTSRDELNAGTGKLIRRVGVCSDPTVGPGLESTCGTTYPTVSLKITNATTSPSYSNVLTTHWKKIRGSDLSDGTVPGMAVRGGGFYVNLPRSVFRRYVTGCAGLTEETGSALVPSVGPGIYRCDFFDGTSRVFTLPVSLEGIEDECGDVLAVSRSSATLIKNMIRIRITSTDGFTALTNYSGTGKTVFRIGKAGLGAAEEETSALSSHFFFDWMTPGELISEYESDPAFCGDEDYWYFYIPDATDLSDLGDFLSQEAQTGTPVEIVCPVGEPSVTVLTSSSASTATVGTVPTLDSVSGGVGDPYLFDLEGAYTLVPAFREFLADERAAGREIKLYYPHPTLDVTETSVTLPPLIAGYGSTTFRVSSAQNGGIDPTEGSFSVLAEE